MKLNLKAKLGQLNRLNGKETFTVSDLISLLRNLDESAEVKFGVLTENTIAFCQDDNFMFRLARDSKENDFESNYIVQIITERKDLLQNGV